MKKKIIIFGGGISGLTIAHELLDKGYKVTLIEKDKLIGGMVRSRREFNNIPSEHSWRGYAPFYKNTFEILKRIPYKNKTVYDNLSVPIEFYILRDKIATYKPNLNIIDKSIITYYALKYYLSNKRKQKYYRIKLIPLLKNKLSKDGYDFLIEFTAGPGYGMEKKDASIGHFVKFPILSRINIDKYTHKHILNNKPYIHKANDF